MVVSTLLLLSMVWKTDEFLGEGYSLVDPASNPVRFFTPRTVRLGWLDTRQVVGYENFRSKDYVPDFGLGASIMNQIKNNTVDTKLPKIFMGVILLPPAYKQEQYFRMVITHRFAFSGFRGISMSNVELEAPNYFNLNKKLSDGDSDPPSLPPRLIRNLIPVPVPVPNLIPNRQLFTSVLRMLSLQVSTELSKLSTGMVLS